MVQPWTWGPFPLLCTENVPSTFRSLLAGWGLHSLRYNRNTLFLSYLSRTKILKTLYSSGVIGSFGLIAWWATVHQRLCSPCRNWNLKKKTTTKRKNSSNVPCVERSLVSLKRAKRGLLKNSQRHDLVCRNKTKYTYQWKLY